MGSICGMGTDNFVKASANMYIPNSANLQGSETVLHSNVSRMIQCISMQNLIKIYVKHYVHFH